MTRPRDIGTQAETAVVRYLQAHGWPHAERRALRGIQDAGDITGTPGVCWEVKAGHAAETAGDGTIDRWLRETQREAENAHADWGVLVVKRPGHGMRSVGDWWAIVPLNTLTEDGTSDGHLHPDAPVRLTLAPLCQLLHILGYGQEDAP